MTQQSYSLTLTMYPIVVSQQIYSLMYINLFIFAFGQKTQQQQHTI